jgi:hypothetical protein
MHGATLKIDIIVINQPIKYYAYEVLMDSWIQKSGRPVS